MTYVTTYSVPRLERWSASTRLVRPRDGRLRALAVIARHDGPAILHGASGARAGYVDVLGAAAIARRGHRVLVAETTWQPGSRTLERWVGRSRPETGVDGEPRLGRGLTRAVVRAMDHPNIHYAVLSRDEQRTLPATWGIDRSRVHFVAFCTTLKREPPPSPREPSVFSGGNSLRDYRALAAARDRLEWPLTIATTLYGADARAGIGPLAPDAYAASAARSAIAVVALQRDTVRSAGQQTYLNAMLLGQAVVVTEAPGVRDYIDDGRTGLVVANEPDALADAINRLIADPARRETLGRAARAEVLERFRLPDYYGRLLDLADDLTGG
jgi:glycosyltransferase involved in cell wall biosynthesis